MLTRRYEKERDELIELAELKRETLSEELSMLDEQLDLIVLSCENRQIFMSGFFEHLHAVAAITDPFLFQDTE